MLRGSIVALVTPFKGNGIDEAALRRMVDRHIRQGTDALVPVGTTGESCTLSYEEHHRVVEIVVDQARGRVPVVAGTGSNSTEEALSLTKHAKETGADAALMIAPYYNKPTQKGIYQHFKRVADRVDIPIVLYNHQGRTGVTIEPATVQALSEAGNFIAVKDASGGINYAADVLDRTNGKVAILSGNDSWTLALLALGASGCISVVANIIPKKMARFIHAYLDGDAEKSRKLFYKILPLMKAMELEVNPAPVKTALSMMGTVDAKMRLPMTPMDAKKRAALKKVLKEYKLIK